MDYMIDIVWFGDSVIFIFKELTGICKFRPSEATKKQKTPAEEPADTPLEPPDVSWGFDLGMLGMGWNCFNVLLEDFIEVSCFWFSWGSIAAPTDDPGKAPDAFLGWYWNQSLSSYYILGITWIIFDQPKPSEVSDKPLETVVAAPADAHEETPDATWSSDLGMLGMRCAIVLECMLRSYRGTI